MRFWVQKVKAQGHGGSTECLKMHFLALLRYVENYWTEFHRSFSVNSLWDKDERFKYWGQRSKFEVTVGGVTLE